MPATLPIRVVFHGSIAKQFSKDFADVLAVPSEIAVLPQIIESETDKQLYAAADVIVSFSFNPKLPKPERLKLLQMPGAGYDAIDFNAIPTGVTVCNCFGHEQAIAEYVMAAMLMHQIPFANADSQLRHKNWSYRGNVVRDELAGKTIGLFGYGHIGQAIAKRAKAFEMTVHVANRSKIEISSIVDKTFTLDNLSGFWPSADFIVISIALAKETEGIVNTETFATMRPSTLLVNVGRGPIINEQALFDALKTHRIAGAVIDTWYNYPTQSEPEVFPSSLPFQELSNIVMTPHMSGWSSGTIHRRQLAIAENIRRLVNGQELVNVIKAG